MNDEFELVPLRGGGTGIRSVRYGEICHPGVGPSEEAERVYVRGLKLRERWSATTSEFVVWDVGLGGGANAIAVIRAAVDTGACLALGSFDWGTEPLRFATRHASELGYLEGFEAECRELCDRGEVTLRRGTARIRWRFQGGDFTERIRARIWSGLDADADADTEGSAGTRTGAPDAILYDPHSPAANPEMWTLPHFTQLRACLDPDRACSLATYSRSTAVRVALLLAGFRVGAGEGTESKEETTVAASHAELLDRPLGDRWLERVFRSRAAEPWISPPFGGLPLGEANRVRLLGHPQFAGKGDASHEGRSRAIRPRAF